MNIPDMPDQGTNSFKKTVIATLTLLFGAGAALIGMPGIIGMIFGITASQSGRPVSPEKG